MRAVIVVIANVVEEKSLQMPFVHSNDMIQQLPPTAFDPALRHPVLPWTLERGLDRLNPEGSHGSGNLHSVLPVPVEDQKPRNRAKRKGLPQLLRDSLARRMLGDVAVQDAPPVMSDHEKTVQHAKPDGGNREEVHRGNHFLMVAQKGQPPFTWLAVPRRSFHPAGDRPFRDVEPQHQQFPMDAWRSPSGVFRNHAEDQLPQLLRRRPSPNRLPDSGDQPPIHAKAGPVPADNSLRNDDDDRPLPSRPQPTDGNPEELVKQTESRPRMTPFQHGQLLSQHEVFKDEIPAATEESRERREREPEHAEHNRSYNRILAVAAGYVIDFKVRQSCGEGHGSGTPGNTTNVL